MGEAFMVIPLGEDDAETYFEKLPDVIQAIVLAVPDGTPPIVLMLPGLALAVAGMYLIRRGRRHLLRLALFHRPRLTVIRGAWRASSRISPPGGGVRDGGGKRTGGSEHQIELVFSQGRRAGLSEVQA